MKIYLFVYNNTIIKENMSSLILYLFSVAGSGRFGPWYFIWPNNHSAVLKEKKYQRL